MNTETKVHEYHLKTSNRAYGQTAQEIYTRAYNAGKTDAIKEFVQKVKDDIDRLPRKVGHIPIADVDIILSYRMKEALGNEG